MSVMVLNADGGLLHVVQMPKAIRMLVREVAVVQEAEEGAFIGHFPRPKILRLVKYIYAKWLHSPACYGKRAVMARDKFACGYCGDKATTIDHVVPRSHGGKSTWKNTVAACEPCNSRKGSRTPEEARMRLRVKLWTPTRAQLKGS